MKLVSFLISYTFLFWTICNTLKAKVYVYLLFKKVLYIYIVCTDIICNYPVSCDQSNQYLCSFRIPQLPILSKKKDFPLLGLFIRDRMSSFVHQSESKSFNCHRAVAHFSTVFVRHSLTGYETKEL
jgi:hypothetical protein